MARDAYTSALERCSLSLLALTDSDAVDDDPTERIDGAEAIHLSRSRRMHVERVVVPPSRRPPGDGGVRSPCGGLLERDLPRAEGLLDRHQVMVQTVVVEVVLWPRISGAHAEHHRSPGTVGLGPTQSDVACPDG